MIMVGTVMTAASFFILHQREATLNEALRSDVRVHARTVQIALEENLQDDYLAGRPPEAQQLINRLRENTKIYGVVLFDAQSRVVMLSNPLIIEEIRHPPELDRVISTDEEVDFIQTINDEEIFFVILPIHFGADWHGAVEISQPLTFVKAEIARTRRNFVLMTLLLLATIFLGVFIALRRSISVPIKELLSGAAALGRGDLDYRVNVRKGQGEFAQLAKEFNRMADYLAIQRRTAAHEAEERLALERELRHSERLASVGRLAAGVAHEMGAPLNVIDARAEQLLARPHAPLDMRQRNLTIIRAQAERITRIVRQLLNLARPYHLRRKPVELSQMISHTIEQIEANAARAGIVIEFTPEYQVWVETDEEFLRQVLLNICLNGIQAMPTGGRLRVECKGYKGPKDGRPMACVRISDTGSGISPEQLPHIFEPFYTTKEVGQGTGLGLAVARRIVEEHGGRIEAANHPEGGAVFTVYLPEYEKMADTLAGQTDVGSVVYNESAIAGR